MVVTASPALTMLPPSDALPDVLPTDRLTANGKPVPALRTDLRRIDDLRNTGSVLLTWGQAVATMPACYTYGDTCR